MNENEAPFEALSQPATRLPASDQERLSRLINELLKQVGLPNEGIRSAGSEGAQGKSTEDAERKAKAEAQYLTPGARASSDAGGARGASTEDAERAAKAKHQYLTPGARAPEKPVSEAALVDKAKAQAQEKLKVADVGLVREQQPVYAPRDTPVPITGRNPYLGGMDVPMGGAQAPSPPYGYDYRGVMGGQEDYFGGSAIEPGVAYPQPMRVYERPVPELAEQSPDIEAAMAEQLAEALSLPQYQEGVYNYGLIPGGGWQGAPGQEQFVQGVYGNYRTDPTGITTGFYNANSPGQAGGQTLTQIPGSLRDIVDLGAETGTRPQTYYGSFNTPLGMLYDVVQFADGSLGYRREGGSIGYTPGGSLAEGMPRSGVDNAILERLGTAQGTPWNDSLLQAAQSPASPQPVPNIGAIAYSPNQAPTFGPDSSTVPTSGPFNMPPPGAATDPNSPVTAPSFGQQGVSPDLQANMLEMNQAIQYFITHGDYDRAEALMKLAPGEVNPIKDALLDQYKKQSGKVSVFEGLNPYQFTGPGDAAEREAASRYFASRGMGQQAEYLYKQPPKGSDDWNEDPMAEAFLADYRRRQGIKSLYDELNPVGLPTGPLSSDEARQASKFFASSGDLKTAQKFLDPEANLQNDPELQGYLARYQRDYRARPFTETLDALQSPNPFAQGGITSGPTLALVGEAGPEAVVPLGNSPREARARERLRQQGVPIERFAQGGIVEPTGRRFLGPPLPGEPTNPADTRPTAPYAGGGATAPPPGAATSPYDAGPAFLGPPIKGAPPGGGFQGAPNPFNEFAAPLESDITSAMKHYTLYGDAANADWLSKNAMFGADDRLVYDPANPQDYYKAFDLTRNYQNFKRKSEAKGFGTPSVSQRRAPNPYISRGSPSARGETRVRY